MAIFLSSPIDITKGVHQGNVLSPVLFNIFMNDISDRLLLTDAPLINDFKVNHLLCADDLLLLSTSADGMKNNIAKVDTFCKNWGLKINIDTSKTMIFSRSERCVTDKVFFEINSTKLECVSHYLGVILSSNSKFSVAEKNLSLKASMALFSIKQSVFNNNIKPSIAFNIFDSLVKPIALYSSEIWFCYKTSYHKRTLDEILSCTLKVTMNLIKFSQ